MNHLRRFTLPAVLLATAAVTAACSGSSGSATSAAHGDMPMPSHSMGSTGGMHGTNGMTATTDTGTSATSGGYTLKLADAVAPAETRTTLRFTVVGPDGKPVDNYVVDQTKKLHLYVIRTDLTEYQHLHPTLGDGGGWSTPVTFGVPGDYRVIADFVAAAGGDEAHHVLGAPLVVPGNWTKAPLPAPSSRTTVDGYAVTVSGSTRAGSESPLAVRITRNGEPVGDLRPYLGVWAHLGAFHQDDLAVTHLHPTQQPMQRMTMRSPQVLRFMAELPEPGNYRVFMQFRAGGALHTAAITLKVR